MATRPGRIFVAGRIPKVRLLSGKLWTPRWRVDAGTERILSINALVPEEAFVPFVATLQRICTFLKSRAPDWQFNDARGIRYVSQVERVRRKALTQLPTPNRITVALEFGVRTSNTTWVAPRRL